MHLCWWAIRTSYSREFHNRSSKRLRGEFALTQLELLSIFSSATLDGNIYLYSFHFLQLNLFFLIQYICKKQTVLPLYPYPKKKKNLLTGRKRFKTRGVSQPQELVQTPLQNFRKVQDSVWVQFRVQIYTLFWKNEEWFHFISAQTSPQSLQVTHIGGFHSRICPNLWHTLITMSSIALLIPFIPLPTARKKITYTNLNKNVVRGEELC